MNKVGGKDPVLSDEGVLKALKMSPTLKWCGYLSTTGVYGNRDGAEVDETSELLPSGRRGKLRVNAEKSWQETGLPVRYIYT